MIKKYFLILLVLSVVFLFKTDVVFAQLTTDGNTVKTKVGNPKVDLAPNKIIENAISIGLSLRTSYDSGLGVNLFNVKTDEPGVYYWCTYLIIDSYNKAGYTGLTRASHAGVINMKFFFSNSQLNRGQYKFLSLNTPVEQLRPGDVIFFEGKGQHVSLIKSVDINELGHGSIHTYESNNIQFEDVVSVIDHIAQKAQTTSRSYSITGFGQVVGN